MELNLTMDDFRGLYHTGSSVEPFREDLEHAVLEGESLAGTGWIGERFESPQYGENSDKSFIDILLAHDDLSSIIWLDHKSDQLLAREILRHQGYEAFEFWDLSPHNQGFVIVTNWDITQDK